MILQLGFAAALSRISLLCPKPTFQREFFISDLGGFRLETCQLTN
jgi:hypothetical protein